jgi:nucleoside-triphosphatase THEP1
MLDIATKKIFDAEVVEDKGGPVTEIGRYKFYTASFERANEILITGIDKNPAYIVIDEVGKLEMNEKGFYKAVVKLIKSAKQREIHSKIILVVRIALWKKFVSTLK